MSIGIPHLKLDQLGIARRLLSGADRCSFVVISDSYWTQATGDRLASGVAESWSPRQWAGWWLPGARNNASDLWFYNAAGTDPASVNRTASQDGTGVGFTVPANTIPFNFTGVKGTTPTDAASHATLDPRTGLTRWKAGTPWGKDQVDVTVLDWRPGTGGTFGYNVNVSFTDSTNGGNVNGTQTVRTDPTAILAEGFYPWVAPTVTRTLSGYDRIYLSFTNAGLPSANNNGQGYATTAIYVGRPTGPGLVFSCFSVGGWGTVDWGAVPASGGKVTDASFNTLLLELTQSRADPIVLIELGRNKSSTENTELSAGTLTAYKANLTTLINRVKAALPTAKIILMSPPVATLAGTTTALCLTMARACYELARDTSDVAFINGSAIVSGLRLGEDDGTQHPNRLGSKRIADALWRTLTNTPVPSNPLLS